MSILYANNAKSTLATDITDVATELTLFAGTGSLFPSPTGGDYFKLTVVSSDGSLEIMHCTARTADTCTVVRAQEGTTAKAFSSGAVVANRFTAGSIASFNTYSMASNAEANTGTATNVIMNPANTKYFWDQRVTAFTASILDDADAAAVRATLGLVIGTDVQEYDSTTLKASAIGSTVQAYDADTAKTDVQQAWSKPQRPTVTSVNIASAFDASAYAAIKHTLATNTTVAAPSNTPTEGDELYMHIKGASTYTLSLNATYKARADLALPGAPAAGKVLSVCFRYDGAAWQMIGYRVDA